jgi:epoxyqueuosine reductase
MPDWCLRFGIVPLAKNPVLPEAFVDEYTADILRIGRLHGLHEVGVAPADVLTEARSALVDRKARDLHDTMEFTYRNPERSTDPRLALPGAQAMIVGAYSYASPFDDEPSEPSGRVARYALLDYYSLLAKGLNAMRDELRDVGWKAIVVADDNSMVDRASAHAAGLGWFGKNANLLVKGHGSFFVLGSVITNAPLRTSKTVIPDGCGACSRCVTACPTAAIVENGVIDAAKCLAWLIQKPGVFDRRYRVALGNRIYGCDDCQEVCPPTQRLSISVKPIGQVQQWLPILQLLDASDELVMSQVGHWYISDRNPMWVRRNALIILGNIGNGSDMRVHKTIARYVAHPEAILRAHATWAAARLGLRHLINEHDDDQLVIEELRLLPPQR